MQFSARVVGVCNAWRRAEPTEGLDRRLVAVRAGTVYCVTVIPGDVFMRRLRLRVTRTLLF